MNPELLETLLAALQLSPENHLLRKQVVQGLLEAQRWRDLPAVAEPLQPTEHRALALYALAKASFAAGDPDRARLLYQEAVELNEAFIDESFESELEPEDTWRLPVTDPTPGTAHVRAYNGPRITFADVGGMTELKEQIRLNILLPFERPELFAAYGKKVGGGILMFGPPGCGKTHIARATAGEIGANFYALELNEIMSMWVGQSEKQLNELFETARANAPSVIFIDEVDALGAKRSDLHSSPIRMTITQLLTEMDGINSRNHQVLVMGATNEPWNVDAAFRRPGRFDRVLFVPPPDQSARAEILRLHARGRKMDPQLPWRAIAEKTELFSGADLAALIDRACEFALTEALRSGTLRDVMHGDFQQALQETRASTLEWLRRAKNYVTYANQDGFYDHLAKYLSERRLK